MTRHLGMLTDLLRRTDGEHRTVDHRHDAVGDLADQVHIVFDHQDGGAVVLVHVFDPKRHVLCFFNR